MELRDAHFSLAPVVDFSETGWCSGAFRRCMSSPAGRTMAAVILSATALKSVDSLGQETTMVMYVYSCYPARSMHPSYLDRRGRLKRAGGATERRLRRRGGRSGGWRGPPLCHVLPAMARGRRRAAAADDAPIREGWRWLLRSRRLRQQTGKVISPETSVVQPAFTAWTHPRRRQCCSRRKYLWFEREQRGEE